MGAVEPGGFGFPQRSPQPGARRVVECLAGEVGGQGVAERLLESGGLDAAGHVVPDPAEHAEVVGAGQFALEGLGGRQFAAVAGENTGQHRHRVQGGQLLAVADGFSWWQACAFAAEPVGAVEFGGGAAAFAGVGGPAVVGDAVGVVGVAAAAHGDVQSLPVAEAVDQDVGGADGAALRGVLGGRVREGGVIGEVAVRAPGTAATSRPGRCRGRGR